VQTLENGVCKGSRHLTLMYHADIGEARSNRRRKLSATMLKMVVICLDEGTVMMSGVVAGFTRVQERNGRHAAGKMLHTPGMWKVPFSLGVCHRE